MLWTARLKRGRRHLRTHDHGRRIRICSVAFYILPFVLESILNGTLFLLSLVVVVWELGFALPCPIAAMHIAATTVIAAFTRPLT